LAPKEIEQHRIEGSSKDEKLDNLEDHQPHASEDVHHAENEKVATIFSKLPQHLITLIVEHLPLFGYLDFRSTCKELCAAAPPIRYRKLTSLEVQNHLPSPPLLMVLNNHRDSIETNDAGDPLLWDVIDPSRPDAEYPMSIPKSFEGATTTFSSKGWLLARKECDCLLFLNPFTRVSGEYPQDESLVCFPDISFSTAPTAPDCVTIGMYELTSDWIAIKYFQHGDEEWNVCEFPTHEKGFKDPQIPHSSCPVYHAGAFYFLDKEGYLGVFERKGGEGSWRVFDKHAPMRCSSVFSSNIVECDGQIVVVVVGHMGMWVDVFRWDNQAEDWNKVESLGNWTIFINPLSCFSTEARRPGMENKIYFPRLHGGHVVFYSMETATLQFGASEEVLNDFHGTKEFLNCCWIEPCWSD